VGVIRRYQRVLVGDTPSEEFIGDPLGLENAVSETVTEEKRECCRL